MMTDQALIEAYLNAYRIKFVEKRKLTQELSDQLMEVWEAVDARRAPEDLAFIFDLIQACQDEGEIAYVASGPLQNIFLKHHELISEPLSQMVRQNSQMRKAIQAIIFKPGTAERKALEKILQKYGLHHASL
jgi:hypothetical protein